MNRKSASATRMDREPQIADELQNLRRLCGETSPREEREKLVQSLSQYAFLEPEHQVVFESIRSLFRRGSISEVQLRVHLNNRGFPDTDLGKYFPTAPSRTTASQATDEVTP